VSQPLTIEPVRLDDGPRFDLLLALLIPTPLLRLGCFLLALEHRQHDALERLRECDE
jgi:hypothetical protein